MNSKLLKLISLLCILFVSVQAPIFAETIPSSQADEYLMTPLSYACQDGKHHAAKTLLEKGADPNQQNIDEYTPLHLGAYEGHTEIVKLLLEYKADSTIRGKNNFTPLHFAASRGHKEITSLLLKATPNPNDKTRDGYTPLHLAADQGHTQVVRLLLDYGADPTIQGNDTFIPLHFAASRGHIDIVKALLEATPNPHQKIDRGMTALHLAACKGHLDVISLLLEKGLDSEATDQNDFTPYFLTYSLNGKEAARKVYNRKLTSYEKDIKHLKILWQFYDIEDHVTVGSSNVETGGFFGKMLFPVLAKSLNAYGKNPHSKELERALRETQTKSHEQLAEDIRNGELTFVEAGWKRHYVTLVFYKDYMAICNRAKMPVDLTIIAVVKIDSSKVDRELLDEITLHINAPPQQGVSYLYKTLPEKLDWKSDAFCHGWNHPQIAPKHQKRGNCALASKKTAVQFAMGALRFEKPEEFLDEKLIEKHLKQAKKDYKAYSEFSKKYYLDKIQKKGFHLIAQDDQKKLISQANRH